MTLCSQRVAGQVKNANVPFDVGEDNVGTKFLSSHSFQEFIFRGSRNWSQLKELLAGSHSEFMGHRHSFIRQPYADLTFLMRNRLKGIKQNLLKKVAHGSHDRLSGKKLRKGHYCVVKGRGKEGACSINFSTATSSLKEQGENQVNDARQLS